MDLILWRHAEALEPAEAKDDLARALTAKGERQAQRMAEWLNQRMAHTTQILVSPALRCQQTAKALGKKFKTSPELAPDGSEPVLVIGHQPTLGLVASFLLTETPQPWTIKKGAVWWIRGRQREGESQVVLQAVQAPDCL